MPERNGNDSLWRERYEEERRRNHELEARLQELVASRDQLVAYAQDLQRTYGQLRHQLQRLTVLHSLTTVIGGGLRVEQVVGSTVEGVRQLVAAAVVRLQLEGEEPNQQVDEEADPAALQPALEAVTEEVLRSGTTSTASLVVQDPSLAEARGAWHVLGLPLRAGGSTIGALVVVPPAGRVFAGPDVQVLELVAVTAAVAVRNARLYEETQRLAITDPMTGVYNYRYFQRALEDEVQRARRIGYPLGLLLADIDHFKQFNDTYGHLVGDQALQMVARTMQGRLRKTDVIARYGGEEFMVLLPNCQAADVLCVAEDLRRAVARARLVVPTLDHPVAIELSIGGASHAPAEADALRLVREADEALYVAKRQGRNRVHVQGCEIGERA